MAFFSANSTGLVGLARDIDPLKMISQAVPQGDSYD
jgi:hypothetical protein